MRAADTSSLLGAIEHVHGSPVDGMYEPFVGGLGLMGLLLLPVYE